MEATLRDALRAIAPSGRRVDLLAVLGRSIAWDNVRHWTAGRRPVPQWAIERLAGRLEHLASVVRASGAAETKEVQGARHWRAYHARRAREKDEQARKEKSPTKGL